MAVKVFLALALVAALWPAWRWIIIRCERANAADWGNVWLNRLDGLNRVFCRKFHRLMYEPLPLPETAPAIVVANHVSGLDPLLMVAASPRPLRFMIATEEYERWWLKWLFKAIGCIPVERHTRPHVALAAARRALLRGEVVALFPHGRIHLDHEPMTPLKRGVVHLAETTGAPIIALRLDGVRAQGHTVAAVFVRSRALLRTFPPLYYRDADADRLLDDLARLISGKHGGGLNHPG